MIILYIQMEKKEEMEKLPFKKADLIKDLKIKKMGELFLAKLINYNVKILISINPHGDIYLVGFYKQPGIQIKGITRCALYVLLKELLEKGMIQREQKMKVSAPTPDDGNLERLINWIYTWKTRTRTSYKLVQYCWKLNRNS